jgi:predicted DNA-binding transcriptional regulator YafY
MDAIMRAIRAEKKLAFDYEDADGQQVVSPYKMALRGGIYYLVCYDERKNDMAIHQIEYMHNAVILDVPAKDHHMVKGTSQWNYALDTYLDQHIPK